MMTIHDRLDVIEEKLDELLELLAPPLGLQTWYPNYDTTGNYPTAPHEQVIDIYGHPTFSTDGHNTRPL